MARKLSLGPDLDLFHWPSNLASLSVHNVLFILFLYVLSSVVAFLFRASHPPTLFMTLLKIFLSHGVGWIVALFSLRCFSLAHLLILKTSRWATSKFSLQHQPLIWVLFQLFYCPIKFSHEFYCYTSNVVCPSLDSVPVWQLFMLLFWHISQSVLQSFGALYCRLLVCIFLPHLWLRYLV